MVSLVLCSVVPMAVAQGYGVQYTYPGHPGAWGPGGVGGPPPSMPQAMANTPYGGQGEVPAVQYGPQEGEMILQDQMSRMRSQAPAQRPPEMAAQATQQEEEGFYDTYDASRPMNDEYQVRQVMAEARRIARFVRKRNGKPFIVIDKRNFQFYLYDKNGRLLRIGPVAIGKGRTRVGNFVTPAGIFPIKSKVPVADWIRPDWYFIEEGEPIPKRWEDRRVRGFFRYKLTYSGQKYLHYAEYNVGRLTHGCIGLDWQDAEAVFHTLDVGSYCIIIDEPFLRRLARGEFPIHKPAVASAKGERRKRGEPAGPRRTVSAEGRVFRNMW